MLNINFKNNKDLDFIMYFYYLKSNNILNNYNNLFSNEEKGQIYNIMSKFNTISIELINEVKNKELYKKAYDEITNTNKYKDYLKETKNYRDKVIGSYNNKKELILGYLNSVNKSEINENIDFYLVNPSCYQGSSNMKERFAVFGSEKGTYKGDMNYALVYIVHETLHLLYPYNRFISDDLDFEDYRYRADIIHKIIEYIADRDLAIILSGKEYPQHEHLDYISEEFYNDYKKYLESNEYNNLFEFINACINKEKTLNR